MARRKKRKKRKKSKKPLLTFHKLISAAKQAQKQAYCPYSHYPVGSAVLTDSGRIYSGANVENASLGLSLCAERVAIFNAVSHGEKVIKAVCVVARSARPCGACRQVMMEFAPKKSELICIHLDPIRKKQKITRTRIARTLPHPFGALEAGL